MTFCYAPWSNIDISPQGHISPCCKFRHNHYGPALKIQDASIEQYETSAALIEIKKDFEQGNWPKGCERCRIEEENGIASKRQLDFDRWEKFYNDYDKDTDGFLTASIAFGNTCNLKCITCGPESSSSWSKEYFEIYGQEIFPNHFYKEHLADQLISKMPNVIHLDIPGGEPFLSGVKEQKKLLDRLIDSGRAQEIGLHYTTNLTIFPDDEWWEIWKNFRNIDLQLSIDGVGSRFEYLRYPARWSQALESVDRYLLKQGDNIQISVSHTVSALNVFYLDEFFNWCDDRGLPRPWCGRVHTPAHLRPSVWPSYAKQKIVDRLRQSRHQDVLTWADLLDNTDDSMHHDALAKFLATHDAYRNLDFRSVFPELADWI